MGLSRRFVVVAGLASFCLATVALGTAQAASTPYPPATSASLAVSTTEPTAGQTITVTGSNFGAKEHVDLTLHSPSINVGSPKTDAAGSFSTTVKIPASFSGKHSISGVGSKSGLHATVGLVVTPAIVISGGGGSTGSGGGTGAGTGSGTSGAGSTSGDGSVIKAVAKVTAPNELAFTGFAVMSVSLVGVLAIALGGLVAYLGRRRTARSSSS